MTRVINTKLFSPLSPDTLDFDNPISDLNGPWNDYLAHSSPLYDHYLDPYSTTNVDYVIKLWLEKGLPENKLVMGAPTYGYSYKMVNEYSHNIGDKYEDIGAPGPIMETPGSLAFYEICSSPWHRVYDSGMKSGSCSMGHNLSSML